MPNGCNNSTDSDQELDSEDSDFDVLRKPFSPMLADINNQKTDDNDHSESELTALDESDHEDIQTEPVAPGIDETTRLKRHAGLPEKYANDYIVNFSDDSD